MQVLKYVVCFLRVLYPSVSGAVTAYDSKLAYSNSLELPAEKDESGCGIELCVRWESSDERAGDAEWGGLTSFRRQGGMVLWYAEDAGLYGAKFS